MAPHPSARLKGNSGSGCGAMIFCSSHRRRYGTFVRCVRSDALVALALLGYQIRAVTSAASTSEGSSSPSKCTERTALPVFHAPRSRASCSPIKTRSRDGGTKLHIPGACGDDHDHCFRHRITQLERASRGPQIVWQTAVHEQPLTDITKRPPVRRPVGASSSHQESQSRAMRL